MHERGSEMVRQMVSSAHFGKLTLSVVASVELSFLDGARTTRSEIRRRTNMCWDLVLKLRGDLKWSVEKILDHLTAYLRCELDGIPYNPEKNNGLWKPDSILENAAALTSGR